MDLQISVFSLISEISSAIKTSRHIGVRLAEIQKNPNNIDESLQRFATEVEGLKNVLDAVYVGLEKVSKLPTWVESDNDKDVWTAVYVFVSGCNKYLMELISLLLDIQKSEDSSASLALRAKRLRINKEDFDINRARVNRYSKKLELALTMINLLV
jgi:hypothetical protein